MYEQIPLDNVSFNPWQQKVVQDDLKNGQKQVVAAGREVTKTSLNTFLQATISTGSHRNTHISLDLILG